MTASWRSWTLSIVSWLVIGSAIASSGKSALAQITPDTTLGNENSTVTSTGEIDSINGGATRGANLFHSFGEFNVGEGRAAVFTNPPGIENILTRVTGANPSNILGTLGVAGNANLFLINPNGIIFGQNARLDIGGSFVGTTANAIAFGNQGFFSATNKNSPSPLLTINPSALLFNQIKENAAIQNNSLAPAGRDPAGFNAFGLRVPDGKSLLLVGGDVSMDKGRLNANGGRVELGGLDEPGTVLLGIDGDNLSLIFPENVARGSVSLINSSGVLVTGAGGGNIVVNASNLEILGGTVLTAGIGQGLGTPKTVAGDITLNATKEITIAGESIVRNLVRLGSQGNGGNIIIDSGSFSLRDRAQLTTATFGQGNAGHVTVGAKDAVSLAGNAGIFSTVGAGGVGKGGNIDINAATLSLIDGSQLITATREASNSQLPGRGDAGNVNVKITGAVDIAGEKNGFFSEIISSVETGTEGDGGNITIDSDSFSLQDRAQLTASTSGQGNAGIIKVNAAAKVNISGKSFNSNTGLFVFSESTTGTAGDIIVTSPRVTLDNGGTLNAESALGNGGDINLQTDLLLLRRGAQISTTAGTVQAGGNGGNINIDAPSGFIVTAASENNDITANAFNGQGGKVTINATGIFGIAPLTRQDLERLRPNDLDPSKLLTNDITAISQTNPTLSGTVELNIPDADLNSGLVNLPTVPVDTEVVQACTPGSSQANSEFVVTGRGGLPPNPTEVLNTDAIAVDWVTLQPESKNNDITANSTSPTILESKPIVEAQGWIINKNGQVVLTASVPTATPHSSWQTPANCSS